MSLSVAVQSKLATLLRDSVEIGRLELDEHAQIAKVGVFTATATASEQELIIRLASSHVAQYVVNRQVIHLGVLREAIAPIPGLTPAHSMALLDFNAIAPQHASFTPEQLESILYGLGIPVEHLWHLATTQNTQLGKALGDPPAKFTSPTFIAVRELLPNAAWQVMKYSGGYGVRITDYSRNTDLHFAHVNQKLQVVVYRPGDYEGNVSAQGFALFEESTPPPDHTFRGTDSVVDVISANNFRNWLATVIQQITAA